MVIALKNATFSASEGVPETTLETMYFILFLKNLSKSLEMKLVMKFILTEQINFKGNSFFCML